MALLDQLGHGAKAGYRVCAFERAMLLIGSQVLREGLGEKWNLGKLDPCDGMKARLPGRALGGCYVTVPPP